MGPGTRSSIRPCRGWCLIVVALALMGLLLGRGGIARGGQVSPRAYIPYVTDRSACTGVSTAPYAALTIEGLPSDRPAAAHPDLNLGVRGYVWTTAYLGLVNYNGAGDPNAPRLWGLFADRRVPAFVAAYRVYDWNWACNCRGNPIGWPEVTLLGMRTRPGEVIHVPPSGYSIGSGYQVLVLYASGTRITLKYTREDNVVQGYTIHVEGVCVDPALLRLYRSLDAAGRTRLPALRGEQPFGRALSTEIKVAVRDTGMFMDPRSRKDWW